MEGREKGSIGGELRKYCIKWVGWPKRGELGKKFQERTWPKRVDQI